MLEFVTTELFINLIKPIYHMWFLHAMMFIFVGVILLEKLQLLQTPGRWLATFLGVIIMAMILDQLFHSPRLNQLPFLTTFFILGCGFHRHADTLSRPQVIVPAICALILAIGIQQAAYFGLIPEVINDTQRVTPYMFFASTTLLLVIFRFRSRFKHAGLALIGSYAFSIYLFHLFGLKLAHYILAQMPLPQNDAIKVALILFFLMPCGLFLPILAENILKRNQYTAPLFLGINYRPSKPDTLATDSTPKPPLVNTRN